MKKENYIITWCHALRIRQWTKNALVMAAWFFAAADPSQATLARGVIPFLLSLGMACAFCLISSSFYLLNDVSDFRDDRRHPIKRMRPIASGVLNRITAVRAALVLFACGVAYPSAIIMLRPSRTVVFGCVLLYTVMQCFYSGLLKRVPYVDVGVIALGFVVRAVAGAAVIGARISPWLLACVFSLALFLALCKRRHEKLLAPTSRTALARYNLSIIDVLIILSAAATLAIYTAYTLSADTLARFHSHRLSITAVWVLLGLVRYLFLTHKQADVGRPERILLSDKILWLILMGWGCTALLLLTNKLQFLI